MARTTVMGTGSWGTTFGRVLADAGNKVTWWSFQPEVADQINNQRHNDMYLPGIELPTDSRACTDPEEALADAEYVFIALPAQTARENYAQWGSAIPSGIPVVTLMKGIELGTGYTMAQVIEECIGTPHDLVTAVSGPNLAKEIAARQPAATVVAAGTREIAQQVQDLITTPYFRPYWTTDVVGVEIGGAVKNVVALANGMAAGLGFGENAQASLITRGLAEMTRLGVAMGGEPVTFLGLAGVGDLLATATSPLSRNRTFGMALGEGHTVDEARAIAKQTAEGAKSAQPLVDLGAKYGVSLPITEGVVRVMAGDLRPADLLSYFMQRDIKPEYA